MDQTSITRPSEKFRAETLVELQALLDQYSELQFEEITTRGKSWVCHRIESDSMLPHQPEEVIPRLRPGISIKQVMITAFFTVRQLIALNVLPQG
jgi:hypothetical protein